MSTEHAEQIGFVSWFRARFPGVLIFAIPNGGKRDIVTAKKLQAEGVTPGVPDLFVPAWTLWIEMKNPGGRLSPAQIQLKDSLERTGYTVIVGYGARDASEQVLRYVSKNPPRLDNVPV